MDQTLNNAVQAARPFAERLFSQLAAGTRDAQGGITRPSYGAGEQFAHNLLAREAAQMGLSVAHDAALNTYMTLPGRAADSLSIIIGSHLDSVAQGGNFDGAAGVIAGLTALSILRALGIEPAVSITAMGIRAEESAWFQTSYIGSKAALGVLGAEALDCRRVDTGRSLAEHMQELGGRPEELLRQTGFLDPARLLAYIEVHIEQAPSLVNAGNALGIGTAIPGNFRYPEISVAGTTAHVGLPRKFRHDALLAAADFVTEMDRIWQHWEHAGRPMAFTVGRFHTDNRNDAMTKVPGQTRFSLDVRAYDERDLVELQADMDRIVAAIQAQRGVVFSYGVRTTAKVARADPAIAQELMAITREQQISVQNLPSPASHDAAVFCSANVPMGLLLIRNENGSHNPDEQMDIGDFMQAVSVLTAWLLRRAGPAAGKAAIDR
jgi:N-carbamoyl-L-amino-acid hydrolase